ncbi:Glutamate/phenylalanine/leucine/valine dehydrogenase domain-containing protein [Rozella allomycis CSF55]|uniref:NAD-specific glutamate dehydrogenase n=1 Tax=Rozella allomycis (strain CSF55) TaxID=988480 RepID=A0A075B0U2_ROZAC|nr:Glutamate/phenylalanine/leucine/valine dehydrogenase domain-containing protein [Rozella allomycis CSF55]|eukprot:EPZ36174.1 Glutamate/phenylalanine/leucine/valine dehydrogenase domain-containing protein [Rozella allomycis CSF55]
MSPTMQEEDYKLNHYEEKPSQMLKVQEYIEMKGFIPKELVKNEVLWFYNNLGIDDMYFSMESVEEIGSHVMALYAAKMQAYLRNEKELEVHLERETDEGALFIFTSPPGVSVIDGPQYERIIDKKYLDMSNPEASYRLETYRSSGTVSSSLKTQLRVYFVAKCQFVNPHPNENERRDITQVSDKTFLTKASKNTLEIYERIIKNTLDRTGAVIETFDVEGSRQKRVVIGFKQQTTQSFFSSLSDLYHYYELYSNRKYVEQFSNGVTIMCLYLNPMPGTRAPPIEHSIVQIVKEASLIHCLPTTPLQDFFRSHQLSVQEMVYGYVGWIFASHFLNRLGNEYKSLKNLLDEQNALHMEVLTKMKKRLRQDTFTREYILDIIKLYPELIKALYVNFATVHYVHSGDESLGPSLSYQRLQTVEILTEDQLKAKIKRTVGNSHELHVFESFLSFNKHVLKTNFYQPTKVALSFRLEPSFIPDLDYQNKLYGMFLVVGSEFRGFHLRFEDIARGGIRIIKSRNREAYSINLRSLFDENYALAATQQRKNKDIPEGGSKGTILLDAEKQNNPRQAFEKYVDSILDLLIVGQSPGIKEKIVDLYCKEEILFFGPDEGTADYMDWASQHAKRRGAHFWKAFTTGKSQKMGGIPHDLFGMTTRSVHQFVLGIYKKLNLNEGNVTKFQTGGPDGDLGSNEIKISRDKTIAIVDGSGVLFDPEGLNRDELNSLAQQRKMISYFDVSKLGKKGFRVLVDENNIRLPDGTFVENGLKFRNEFHLNRQSSCDIFVPCGGRPEAVDISNVDLLFDDQNKPRFKYIVEGANLFFTQEARIKLEKAGVVIYKDASANKGGVTSSSLEVLAALAFTDSEFETNMQVFNGQVPEFYSNYIKNVHQIIENNAYLEFDAIWKEHSRTNTPRSILSDDLSLAIIKLNNQLQNTTLWDNYPLRLVILNEAFPRLLIEKIGLEKLLERIPESYVKALFGSYLASRFVYKYGIDPSQFAFFEFMAPYFEKVNQKKL